jgi:hypothetical protein
MSAWTNGEYNYRHLQKSERSLHIKIEHESSEQPGFQDNYFMGIKSCFTRIRKKITNHVKLGNHE